MLSVFMIEQETDGLDINKIHKNEYLKYWLFISFVIPVNLNEKHVRPIRGSALVHIICHSLNLISPLSGYPPLI